MKSTKRFKAQACFGGFRGCEIEYVPTGYNQRRCPPCARMAITLRALGYQRLKREADPTWGRERHLIRKYGLTLVAFEAINAVNAGNCTFCGKPPADGSVLRVEHDHNCPNGCSSERSCGQCIRGLVHDRCNQVIAIFEYWGASHPYLETAPERMERNNALREMHDRARRAAGRPRKLPADTPAEAA